MAEPSNPTSKLEEAVETLKRSLSGLDLSKLQSMFENITDSVHRWNESIDRTVDDMKIMIDYMSKAAQIDLNLEMGGRARNQEASIEAELQREERAIDEERLRQGDDIFSKLKREYELTKEMYQLDNQRLSTAYQTSEALARAATHIEGIMPSLLSAIPFGGFIGFMLAGAVKEASFQADTQKVVQAWKVVGGAATEFGHNVEGMLKDFGADAIISSGELRAIAGNFAAMGVQAKDVLQIGGTGTDVLKNMGLSYDNIFKATLAMDKLNQTSAGTFAGMAGTAVRDFNNTITEATSDLISYGMAAQNAGQNTMTFLSGVMQNAQQLKLYAIHLGDVASMTTRLIEMNKHSGLQAGFAGQVAQTGMGQITSGISGMADGLAAFLGGHIFQSMGMTGVDALMEFKRGGRDLSAEEQRKFFAATVAELGQLAKDTGLKGLSRDFFLDKMGFGVEGSHAIMQLFDKMGGKFDPSKLDKKDMELLNKSLEDESKKTSAVVELLRNLQTAIADIGNGLLGMILASLKVLIQGVQYGFDRIIFAIPGDHGITAEDLKAEYKQLSATAQRVGAYGQEIGEGITRLGHAAGKVTGIGALGELSDVFLHGASRTTDSPLFGEYMRKEYDQRNREAWQESIDEGMSDAPLWVRSLIKSPIPGMMDPDSLTRLSEVYGGTDGAKNLVNSIDAAYQKRRGKILPDMKVKYDGLEDIIGFTVYFHKADGTKAIDGGTGRR